MHSNQMDVLILTNVLKEVIIATHMQRVITREEHFIVNVILDSKVMVKIVKTLTNALKLGSKFSVQIYTGPLY